LTVLGKVHRVICGRVLVAVVVVEIDSKETVFRGSTEEATHGWGLWWNSDEVDA
jgi:hypothetical protein